jgi:hypothetical protein
VSWVRRHGMALAVGALGATAAGSLLMVRKGELKREEDFAKDGQLAVTKGDLHPAHACGFGSVASVQGGNVAPAESLGVAVVHEVPRSRS